jgi:hypothetical protein
MTPPEQFARFRRSRREAAVIGVIFVAVFGAVVGAAALSGFREDDCVRAGNAGFVTAGPIVNTGLPAWLLVHAVDPGAPADSEGIEAHDIPDGYRLAVTPGSRGFLAPPGDYVQKGRVLARPVAERPPATLLGLPSWVVLYVFAPWIGCIGITVWFGCAYMKDEPAADAAPHPPGAEAERLPAYRVEPADSPAGDH